MSDTTPSYYRPFVGFLLRHLLAGTVGAMAFGGLILWRDVAGLRTLIDASPDGILYLLMLFFGLWITFGSIAMAVGVMQLGEERD
jgi:hypothetical protein